MIARHLLAAALACVLLIGGLTFASWYVRSLEDRYIHALAPSQFALKNQGTELQAAAFRQSDLLVVYGSSELEFDNPYHSSPNVSGLFDGLYRVPSRSRIGSILEIELNF